VDKRSRAEARLLQIVTQSRFSLWFAHDLRVNALLRLSHPETGAHLPDALMPTITPRE